MKINGETNLHHLVYTLQHGRWILYSFKEVSLGQSRIFVAAIFGVAASLITALALRVGNMVHLPSFPWLCTYSISEQRDPSKKLCFVAGLQNIGNNCFLNVILQVLASCCCFQTFLENTIQENGTVDEKLESMPLTIALATLLKELSILREERVVASPRRVMLALDLYITSFNLTKQQDAAEAFLHLLSSLKEEFLEGYVPHYGSLADIIALPLYRISCSNGIGSQNEWQSWQQHFFTPFDGTLGSILTCKGCSSQLSMEFEVFHCLPLSPMLHRNATIVEGYTLEDCLRRFTAAEHVSYQCSQCCHMAAEKSLSFEKKENETKLQKLRNCSWHDGCDCKNLFMQEGLQWPTESSHAVKQLSIGRCPKILCIHLQRASMNEHGETIKLQGHISFPGILDFSPFTSAGMGMGTDIDVQNKQMQVKQLKQPLVPHLNYFNMQMKMQMLETIDGNGIEHIYQNIFSEDNSRKLVDRSSGQTCMESLEGEEHRGNTCVRSKNHLSEVLGSGTSSKHEEAGLQLQYNERRASRCSLPSKSCIYCLVSAVEHYGRDGDGHYAVYRRVEAGSYAEESLLCDVPEKSWESKTADAYWFCISDSKVSRVSEETVLAAEASLLFYERVEAQV